MNDSHSTFQKFRSVQADKLFELIKSHGLLGPEEAEAFIHALNDISESIERIYCELVPNMLNSSIAKDDDLKDKLWDVREEFRHIEYHLKDAKLTEL